MAHHRALPNDGNKKPRSWPAMAAVVLTLALGLFVLARFVAGSVALVERVVDIPRALAR